MVRFFNIAELIVIVVAASLLAAALVGWLHERNIHVLRRGLGFLHRPLGEALILLVCVVGLVHYGATKGFLGRQMMMAPREMQQELLSEPETSADFAGMFPPYTNVVTNVCATGIGVTETSVVLRTHWSLDDYFAGMGVEVYATDELLSNSWFGVGTASIGSDEGSAIIELPHSLLPGGLSSSMFFTIGLNIDTDRDGLSDFFEGLITKTDPHSIDSDRDGMPDGWEYSNELDPASSEGNDGANGDPDGDGQSNLSEYMAGSNPKDASSSGYNPPGETIEIPLSVGSDAAAWDVDIAGNGPDDTSVRHIVMDTDLVWITNRMSFCKGNSYTVTLHWRHNDRLKNAGNRKCPWYCWELQANGSPTNAMYREDSAIRLNTHDYIVGENYIIDNREGLFTKEVHEASLDGGTNVAEMLKAHVHLPLIMVEGLRFNYDVESESTDAINIRKNYQEEYVGVQNGEWVLNGATNYPACYIAGITPKVKAKFSISPTSITQAVVSATAEGETLRNLKPVTVRFDKGVSNWVEFEFAESIPNTVGISNDKWNWVAMNFNNWAELPRAIAETGPHKVYRILSKPIAPWDNMYGSSQNAWSIALDEICQVAAGVSASLPAYRAITSHLFFDKGYAYDTFSGGRSFYGDFIYSDTPADGVRLSAFYLSEYLKNSRRYVNCYDQALGLSVLGKLIGADSCVKFATPFGFLNPVNLVGRGLCNNPSCSSADNLLVGLDDKRSYFCNHMYVTVSNVVLDSCVGPELGEKSEFQYWNTVVDFSCEWEAGKTIVSSNGVSLIGIPQPTDWSVR